MANKKPPEPLSRAALVKVVVLRERALRSRTIHSQYYEHCDT